MEQANALNMQSFSTFNIYIPYVITIYVVISILLMTYAYASVFFGLPPFKGQNPFVFQRIISNMSPVNILILIFNILVTVGVVSFIYIGSKDILEQRVIYDS